MNTMCQKYRFSHGADCTEDRDADTTPCVNDCNSRGACMAGWCHCKPGFYGADCSLSLGSSGRPQLLAGLGYRVRPQGPRIYVYELPPEYTVWYNIKRQDRPLMMMIWQRLLSAGVRVADGEEADYYLIPIGLRARPDSVVLVGAIKYLQATWPWWDRLQGRNHLLVHTGDAGRYEMVGEAQRLTANCTMLTSWGLHKDLPDANWRAAHRPGQDIVVPTLISSAGQRGNVFLNSPLHPLHPATNTSSSTAAKEEQPLHLLFAGRICGDNRLPKEGVWPNCGKRSAGYSAGIRQKVHYHYSQRPGYSISVHNEHYVHDLERARFCLAPPGGGFGHRQVLVTFSGCVPLVIGDHMYQPYEPQIDWPSFSVRVAQTDIPHLHEVLEGMSEQKYAALKARLRCAAQHLMYSTFVGGFMQEDGRYDAFETLMWILRMRLKYPEAPPEQYRQLDREFAHFLECRLSPAQEESGSSSTVSNGGGEMTMLTKNKKDATNEGPSKRVVETKESGQRGAQLPLCSLSRYDAAEASCHSCFLRHHHFVPGGAICCGAPNLASCHRPWG